MFAAVWPRPLPPPTMALDKNIWVAAGDGDLPTVTVRALALAPVALSPPSIPSSGS